MEINIYQVDVFTDEVFGGNAAGVVPDASNLTAHDMQKIAAEMNLSETAFIIPINKQNFKVRFFTPVCEVDLCGHATIGSFFTLAQKGYIPSIDNGKIKIFQHTRAGKLPIELYFYNRRIKRVMMQQKEPVFLKKILKVEELLDVFHLTKNDIGIENKFVCPEIISTGLPDIILPIKDRKVLDNLEVNFEKLKYISKNLEVIGVHAFHLPKVDSNEVYTRNFAPAVGINEESATGTSNGSLIYFLKKNGYLNGNQIISKQGLSLNKPSTIYCKITNKKGKWNVEVGGKAKLVLEGIMNF